LTVILGNAQLALQRHSGDRRHGGLGTDHSRRRRRGQPDRQLLAYSRREVVSPRVVDLCAELGTTLPMVQLLLGADVKLKTEFDHGPLWVEIDPTQFQQVLLNLVANARDAMPGAASSP